MLRGPSSKSEPGRELFFSDSRDLLDLSERGNVDGICSTFRYESADKESSRIVGALLAKWSYLACINSPKNKVRWCTIDFYFSFSLRLALFMSAFSIITSFIIF